MSKSTPVIKSVPRHLAIILDGNRRWARQHKLSVFQGHEFAVNKIVQPFIEQCLARGIECVTMWAFSTENWKRDPEEVAGLMTLFRRLFDNHIQKLHEQGVRIKVIGDLSRFPQDIQDKANDWIAKTAQNSAITVVFALNYGGRDEITRAANKAIAKLVNANQPLVLTQELLAAELDTAGLPAPDLIIRPGGEVRLSGFLPWQGVYAEFYFTKTLMPDFDEAELDKALAEFASRQRRFGA